MALQSSGEISLSDIATEFSDTAPHSMSEFYGSGGAPASGEISIGDFYGLSAAFYNGVLNEGSLFLDGQNNAYAYRSSKPTADDQTTATWSFWWKRASDDFGAGEGEFFLHNINNSTNLGWRIGYGDGAEGRLYCGCNDSGGFFGVNTNRLCRDQSGWMHIVIVWDSGNSTESERIRMYINGERETVNEKFAGYPPLNKGHRFSNQDGNWEIGDYGYTGGGTRRKMRSYICDYHFCDGYAYSPTDFGESKSGVWIPKTPSVSYGTAGFHLPLTSNTNDTSGNGHNFTASGISSHDYKLDCPENNFCVFNRNDTNSSAPIEGNTRWSCPSGSQNNIWTTMGITKGSGKWYWEVYQHSGFNNSGGLVVNQALRTANNSGAWNQGGGDGNIWYYGYDGGVYVNGSNQGGIGKITAGLITGWYVDMGAGTNGQLSIYRNGSLSTTVNLPAIDDGDYWVPQYSNGTKDGGSSVTYNFGQDGTFNGTTTSGNNTDTNGLGDFKYSVPSGAKALCSANLEVATAVDPGQGNSPQDYFNTVLYTGNSSTNNITGVGFQPDWVWIKQRNASENHFITDAVRGAGLHIRSDATTAESDSSATFTSFNSDGFSLTGTGSAAPQVNDSSDTYASWNWKANGSGSSNTDGSITSTVSANTGAGFSIVSWTGTGSTATVGHGLNSAPEMMLVKGRDNADQWFVYHAGTSGTPEEDYIYLNLTSAALIGGGANPWNDTAPTSSVFSLGSDGGVNGSSLDYIGYCFHSVEGYSKFGSYTGNGSTDGTFVYTGFRPAYVIQKRADSTSNWVILDNKREGYNPDQDGLDANGSGAEGTAEQSDFLSNGFKLRNSSTGSNASGGTFIYMAFAESPFKYANAR